jgi:hypothetical protein
MWNVLEPETLVIDSPLSFEDAATRLRVLVEAESGTLPGKEEASSPHLHFRIVRRWTEDTHAFSLKVELRPNLGGSQAILASQASLPGSLGPPIVAAVICAVAAYQYGVASWQFCLAVLALPWLLYEWAASCRHESRRLQSALRRVLEA